MRSEGTSETIPGAAASTDIVEVRTAAERREDLLAVEEPLEIRVVADSPDGRRGHSIAVTMRTPGHDFELAAGFLLSEGVIESAGELWRLDRCREADEESADNIVEAHLSPGVDFDAGRFSRHVFTSSSCGICGKASIDRLTEVQPDPPSGRFTLDGRLIRELPARMLESQTVFARTGGLHAAALWQPDGRLHRLREDVGRHNAVDKLVGAGVLAQELPLADTLLLVSGRASFELVQKALVAGIPALLAVGAPSSLAVATARRFGMTLVGFVKRDGFNVYSGEGRLICR